MWKPKKRALKNSSKSSIRKEQRLRLSMMMKISRPHNKSRVPAKRAKAMRQTKKTNRQPLLRVR
jgi:hypothetical protein